MTRIALTLVAALYAMALAAPADATLNACSSAKQLCVAKKAAALLKCHSKNSKPPAGLDPVKFATCIQKAKDKFDGGVNPAKGCFAKLEAKFPGGCLTTSDTAALETQVDDFVDAVICALDPAAGTCPVVPTPTPTSTPACFANGAACASAAQCCSLSCSMGTCAPSCSNGFQDGAETGIDCGGGTCPGCGLGGGCNVDPDCVNGACSGGQCVCGPGGSDCNGLPGDGCEANVLNDNANCGGCNLVCAPPNAAPFCTMGQCTIGSCSVGYADCDAMTGTGCETYLLADPNNCGICFNVCGMAQSCIGGTCQ